MPEVEVEVRRLLDTRLLATSGLPVDGGGTPLVSWENTSFVPPVAGPWLRTTLRVVDASVVAVCAAGAGDEIETTGLYMVDVFVPPGSGPYVADDLAGRVRRQFRTGPRLAGTGVTVRLGPAYRGQGLPSPQEEQTASYMVPVTIPWTAYHPVA
jgi:hypothetical protein